VNSARSSNSAWKPIPRRYRRTALRMISVAEQGTNRLSHITMGLPCLERPEYYAISPLSMVTAMVSFLQNARFTPPGARPSPAGRPCCTRDRRPVPRPSPSPCMICSPTCSGSGSGSSSCSSAATPFNECSSEHGLATPLWRTGKTSRSRLDSSEQRVDQAPTAKGSNEGKTKRRQSSFTKQNGSRERTPSVAAPASTPLSPHSRVPSHQTITMAPRQGLPPRRLLAGAQPMGVPLRSMR
jgi:hypothetical protein